MKNIIYLGWCVFVLASCVVRMIVKCALLKKAGKKWWLGIIPVVSEYKILSISWKRRWLPVYLFAEIVRSFAAAVVRVFINDWTLIIGSLLSPVFSYTMVLLGVVYFLFMITLCANISLHFGKSKEFGFAMAVFPVVFGPVLAFGKNEYTKDAPKWMIT